MSNPVEQFKDYYRNLDHMDLLRLGDIYSGDILFRDPVHEVRGLVALEDYMNQLCSNLDEGYFEYLDQLVGEQSAYIKWIMYFSHPRLGKEQISLRGITHIQFDTRIYYQEDSYDMGAMVYENVPLLGTATRWIKRRLAS